MTVSLGRGGGGLFDITGRFTRQRRITSSIPSHPILSHAFTNKSKQLIPRIPKTPQVVFPRDKTAANHQSTNILPKPITASAQPISCPAQLTDPPNRGLC